MKRQTFIVDKSIHSKATKIVEFYKAQGVKHFTLSELYRKSVAYYVNLVGNNINISDDLQDNQ
jgi:hypothetical protein